VALDPLNRRATRRTFISRASKGARRVAAKRGRRKRRGIKREREEKGVGQKGGKEDRGLRNNAAYGACSSRATRDAVQLPAASSVGSRTKPCASRARATGSPLSFPLPFLFPVASYCRSTLFENAPCFPLPPVYPALSFRPCFASFLLVMRVIGREFSGIKLQRREELIESFALFFVLISVEFSSIGF